MEQKDFEKIQEYQKRRSGRIKIKRYQDRKNKRLLQKNFQKVLTNNGENDIIDKNMDDWDESNHPRAKNGQFTSGSGSSGGTKSETKEQKKKEPDGEEKKSFESVKPRVVKPKEFSNSVAEAKASGNPRDVWRVTAHSEDELKEWYPDAKMYVADRVGTYAINDDGDIISVCKYEDGVKGKGRYLMEKAIQNGGKKLDSYSGNHSFYTKMGFEPVSWCKWDEKYAPEDWDKNEDKPENIIFYKYTGKQTKEKAEEFFARVKPSNDYDEAKNIRDMEMK